MNNKKIKKFAFTLAETLVTLTIIGVVMALMLRAVNRVNPNKDKLLFLKSYKAIEQAIEVSINDQNKYDQATYSTAQRNALAEADRHEDFRDKPYSDYSVSILGGAPISNISQGAAVCYWLAENMNLLSFTACGTQGVNFKTTNNVCFGDWVTNSQSGVTSGYVQPDCKGTTYKVTVFHNGQVTVPADSAAVGWMTNQTDLR